MRSWRVQGGKIAVDPLGQECVESREAECSGVRRGGEGIRELKRGGGGGRWTGLGGSD